MTVTKTTLTKEGIVTGVGNAKIYNITPDNSWLAVGEVLDLSADFDDIYWAGFGGSKAINGYKLEVVLPDNGTATSSTNVLMTAHYSTDAAGAMTAVPDATDLSTACANARLLVIGKPKIATSWA